VALFTLEELASYLQRDLDTATATLCRAMGTALVKGHLRSEVESTTYTGVMLPIDGSGGTPRVWLPQRPVTDVAAVSVAGQSYAEGADYVWDAPMPVLRLRTIVYGTDSFPADPVATVTYTAGWVTVPDDIKAVALSVASRAYTRATGAKQESIDDYSITYAGADGDLAGVGLTATEVAVLRRYRSGAGTAAVA